MCNQPKITVIVLIYNVEHYIERCVESIYNQSLDSIEYIFIDDCSTDSSISLLKKVMNRYPARAEDSIIITNKTNQGQALNRIKGIRQSHGKYVIFCDSDDSVASDAYRNMYEYIESTQSDIIACNFYRVCNTTQKEDVYLGIDTPYGWIKNILLSKKMSALWCHLIKKELLVDVICPKGNIMEDTFILTQCIIKSQKVGTLRKALYYYYYRDDSISHVKHKTLEQAMHMQINLQMTSTLLLNEYKPSVKKELQCKFFFIKKWLFPIINNTKDCKFWIDFQKEINFKILLNPYISIKDKVAVLLVYLRLYPLIKRLKQ